MSPYDGVVFHETPLSLLIFSVLDSGYISWLFMLGDLVTGFILYKVGEQVAGDRLISEDEHRSAVHSEARTLLSDLTSTLTLPRTLMLAHLLNPLSIANCGAMTSTVWSNLVLATCLLCLVKRQHMLGAVLISLAAYQSMYPAFLIVPLALSQEEIQKIRCKNGP